MHFYLEILFRVMIATTSVLVGKPQEPAAIFAEVDRINREYPEAAAARAELRLQSLREGMAKGDPEDTYFLGLEYQTGKDVEEDFGEARRLYLIAAAKGYGPAFRAMGDLYYFGWGVPKDYPIAHAYYLLARKFGLEKGIGKDFTRASWVKDRIRDTGEKLSTEEKARAEAFADRWAPGISLPGESGSDFAPVPQGSGQAGVDAAAELSATAPDASGVEEGTARQPDPLKSDMGKPRFAR